MDIELCPTNMIFYSVNLYDEVYNMYDLDHPNKFKMFGMHW